MKQNCTLTLPQQHFMLAVRREVGWPMFAPANDCIIFSGGRPMDAEVVNEMARIAAGERKDAIYLGWACAWAAEPTFAIIYREFMTVDVIDQVVPFAAEEDEPLRFINSREDEFFAVDRRGSLLRLGGAPRNIKEGKKLAMKRLKASAAAMADRMFQKGRLVTPDGQLIAPAPRHDIVVKFA